MTALTVNAAYLLRFLYHTGAPNYPSLSIYMGYSETLANRGV